MAKTIIVSGGGQFVVELGILAGGRVSPLTGTLVDHSQTVAVDEINTWSAHSHLVMARDMTVLDALLKDLMLSGVPKLAVRVGCVAGETAIFQPWQTHIVHWFNAVPQGLESQAGPALKIETRDLLYTLQRGSKIRSRKGRISDIVSAIAAERGLGSVVEKTNLDGLWTQSYETDFKFLARLSTRAVNQSGRGNYRIFVKDDILHFHTPEYQADLGVADYVANSTKITMVDNSQRRAELGAAGVELVSTNPKTGKTQLLVSSTDASVRLADASPVFDRDLVARGSRHAGHNQDDEVLAQAQVAFESQRAGMFEIMLESERAMHLRLNDLLNLRVAHGQSQVSNWSGLYHTVKCKSVVERGAMTNLFTLQRGELAGPGLQIGQKINLEEVRSSNLTRAVDEGGAPSTTVTISSPG